jgi:hypothetical protein
MDEESKLNSHEVALEGIQPFLPGFYSLMYARNEIDDLKQNLFGDLVDEICLLRVILRRALLQAQELKDLKEILGVLNSVGQAAMRLGRLLEVQVKLSERAEHGPDALTRVLMEIGEKLEMQ